MDAAHSTATNLPAAPTPLFAGISLRRARPLFSIDAGWMFLLGGMALIALTVLIPAQHDLDIALWQRDRAAVIEKHRLTRLERYGQYLRAVEGGDESVVMSLAAVELNKSPLDRVPLNPRQDPSNLSASIFPYLEPPAAVLPEKPAVTGRSSILARWTIDEHTRLWLLAGGVLSILIGLLPPSSRAPRSLGHKAQAAVWRLTSHRAPNPPLQSAMPSSSTAHRADSPGSPANPGRYYITTPIYYVNDKPHIGHCYTTTVADAAARFARLLGRDTFFLTGTDEHGQKVEKSAAAKGVTPQQLADENAVHFQAAMKLIGASNDDFIRTTQPRHARQVQSAIQRLIASGDIYLGTFEGWYDEGQEEYVTENAAREKNYTAFNGKPLVKAKEQNYYFKLSKWQPELEKFFDENPEFVRPAARFNEVRGRLKEGLQDVPVSRTNFSWGIPIPGAEGHVTYVWIDALLNYATAVGVIDPAIAASEGIPADRAKYWPAEVHAIGKEILWFHAVIWPALLMALHLPTPKCVYAHSFWISEGKKMSKTLGNFIDLPLLKAYIDRFGLDALRWYLLTQGPLRETDADFSYAKFVEVYNADLANGIGNCASRVGNMIEKYFGGTLPAVDTTHTSPTGTDWTVYTVDQTTTFDFRALASTAFRQALEQHEAFRLDEALMQGTAFAGQIDLFINHTRPFSIAKEMEKDPAQADVLREKLAHILVLCAEGVRVASLFLFPAMPSKVAQLWKTWNCSPLNNPDDPNSGFIAPLSELAVFGGTHALKPGQMIAKGEPLFMRAKAEDPAPAA